MKNECYEIQYNIKKKQIWCIVFWGGFINSECTGSLRNASKCELLKNTQVLQDSKQSITFFPWLSKLFRNAAKKIKCEMFNSGYVYKRTKCQTKHNNSLFLLFSFYVSTLHVWESSNAVATKQKTPTTVWGKTFTEQPPKVHYKWDGTLKGV